MMLDNRNREKDPMAVLRDLHRALDAATTAEKRNRTVAKINALSRKYSEILARYENATESPGNGKPQ